MEEQPLYNAEQLRAIDRAALQRLAITGYSLMTQAAHAALRALRAHWPRAWRIAVVCGAGNNAGDGYLFAQLAAARGLDVVALAVQDPKRLQGDARLAYEAARAAGVHCHGFTPTALAGAEVIVDALLGIGLNRPLSGVWAEAVHAINASDRPVLSLDVPSGLNADTGALAGVAVRADLTLSFIAAKLGLYTGAGPDYSGQVELARLEIPDDLLASHAPCAYRITAAGLAEALPARRRPSDHKGRFGTLLVVGGQPGMSGAARLTAEAAARVGCGRVVVATHPGHAAVLNLGRPELMCHGVTDAAQLQPLLNQAEVLALGPGLGQGAWGLDLLDALWGLNCPKVVDADALNRLAQAPQRREDWILTPHPGEAARLLATDIPSIQADRLAAVRALQARYGGVVVLKGSGTLIADAERVRLADVGNPGMASAGMGDVLTGVIAGLVAQGLSLSAAAAVGVVLHGCAGDSAALAGQRGLLAADLLSELRRWVNLEPC